MATTSSSQLSSLTGLRFFAAIMVFALHVSMIWTSSGREDGRLFQLACSGVSFFFLLSGFVLTWSWRQGQSAGRFWRRRVAKIFPNHLVTWLAGLLLLLATGQTVTVGQWLPNAFLVQSWSPRFDIFNPGVNGVSWSLSCEALFYLSFPLLRRLVAGIHPGRLWFWAAVTVATIVLLPVLVTVLLPALKPEPKFGAFSVTQYQVWLIYVFPPVRMLEFLLGVLLARIAMEGLTDGVRIWHAVVGLAVAYPLAAKAPILFGIAAIPIVPLSLIVLGAANSDIRGMKSLLQHPVMSWLGETSFALYMSHLLVIEYGHRLLDPSHTAGPVQKLLYTAVLLAVAITVAWVLHTVVEKPMMRRLSGRPLSPVERGRDVPVGRPTQSETG